MKDNEIGIEAPDADSGLIAQVLGDGDTATVITIDPETGEVTEVQDAPALALENGDLSDADAKSLCAYLGPRLAASAARRAGIIAERDAWIERITRQYEPLIRREDSLMAWLKGRWYEPLRRWAAARLSGSKVRKLREGLVSFAFRAVPAKVEIADTATALQWAKLACPDAVRVEETLLISKVPADLKQQAATKTPGASGLRIVEASETFKIE